MSDRRPHYVIDRRADALARARIPDPPAQPAAVRPGPPRTAERPRHDREHVWAICRLTEAFIEQWDTLYAALQDLPYQYPEEDPTRER